MSESENNATAEANNNSSAEKSAAIAAEKSGFPAASKTDSKKRSKEEAFEFLAKQIMINKNQDNMNAFLLCFTNYATSNIDLCDIWLAEYKKICQKCEQIEKKAKESGKPSKDRTSSTSIELIFRERMLEFLRLWVTHHPTDLNPKQHGLLQKGIKKGSGAAVEDEFKVLFQMAKSKNTLYSSHSESEGLSLSKLMVRASNLNMSAPNLGLFSRKSSKGGSLGGGIGGSAVGSKVSAKKEAKMQANAAKKKGEKDFLSFSEEMIAVELTMFEFEIFNLIKMREFVNSGWQKSGAEKERLAPNISKMITRFNEVGFWVSSQILTKRKINEQVNLVKKFVKIGLHCRQLGNFNTIMQILSGLTHSAVARLKTMWRSIPKSTVRELEELKKLMNPEQNFRSYRLELQAREESEEPTLPYLGLLLRHLIYLEENDRYLKDGAINFGLMKAIWEQVKKVRILQSRPYLLPRNAIVQNYVTSLKYLEDEDLMYALSIACEPSTRTGVRTEYNSRAPNVSQRPTSLSPTTTIPSSATMRPGETKETDSADGKKKQRPKSGLPAGFNAIESDSSDSERHTLSEHIPRKSSAALSPTSSSVALDLALAADCSPSRLYSSEGMPSLPPRRKPPPIPTNRNNNGKRAPSPSSPKEEKEQEVDDDDDKTASGLLSEDDDFSSRTASPSSSFSLLPGQRDAEFDEESESSAPSSPWVLRNFSAASSNAADMSDDDETKRTIHQSIEMFNSEWHSEESTTGKENGSGTGEEWEEEEEVEEEEKKQRVMMMKSPLGLMGNINRKLKYNRQKGKEREREKEPEKDGKDKAAEAEEDAEAAAEEADEEKYFGRQLQRTQTELFFGRLAAGSAKMMEGSTVEEQRKEDEAAAATTDSNDKDEKEGTTTNE
ncbi:hypothetical protein QOT17_006669 [Balamuthia mandrillaris]